MSQQDKPETVRCVIWLLLGSEDNGMSVIEAFTQQVGIRIDEQIELPSRDASFLSPPSALHPSVQEFLRREYPNGLYSHQSKAISAALNHQDVCLSTSTASGKTAVFTSVAADILMRERHARVVAFYPVRALIQDQLKKWREVLEPLKLSVGFIDGSVDTQERAQILQRHRVILMTPDVAHAWLMSSLGQESVMLLRKNLRLAVLDEAHVYDGVFGTNMAFFLRRFQAVCAPTRIICSTATLGEPNDFIHQLTGRQVVQFGPGEDGSKTPRKTVFVARVDVKQGFELSARLLKALAKGYAGKFIAFADSRKMVELITAAALRVDREAPANADEALEELADETANQLMPYRAGYESDDRQRIQTALTAGQLRGVASTSALELGLDIGEVSLAILLTTPPSMKAFWQRIGRAGRKEPGECLILDTVGTVLASGRGLSAYLERPIEPNWLYRDNRYIQYANALCAAEEEQEAGDLFDRTQFSTLPDLFSKLVAEEISPSQMLPPDLFSLKQRAQGAGPHFEFPLRSGIEPNFKIESQQQPLGSVSFSQLMREAYPGAVYYYMARPFRIMSVNYRKREALAHPEARYTTRPITQVTVFPDLSGGLRRILLGADGFVAEAEMQVAERVSGFKEKRGPNESTQEYGVGSPYAQRALQRFIRTTGVCWYFPDNSSMSDAVAARVLDTFCREYAVQSRDLGVGRFYVRQSPLGSGPVQGVCIFDATHGSLRLTERLGEHFSRVVCAARDAAEIETVGGLPSPLLAPLCLLSSLAESLVSKSVDVGSFSAPARAADEGWVEVIAPAERALLLSGTEASEVTVMGYFYTPQGLKYQLKHENPTVRWTVEASAIQPLMGITKTVEYNQSTGEERHKPIGLEDAISDGTGVSPGKPDVEVGGERLSQVDVLAITTNWHATNKRRLELIEMKAAQTIDADGRTQLERLQRLAGLKRELLSSPSLKELAEIEVDLRRKGLWLGA